jgi:hypothetical protein
MHIKVKISSQDTVPAEVGHLEAVEEAEDAGELRMNVRSQDDVCSSIVACYCDGGVRGFRTRHSMSSGFWTPSSHGILAVAALVLSVSFFESFCGHRTITVPQHGQQICLEERV